MPRAAGTLRRVTFVCQIRFSESPPPRPSPAAHRLCWLKTALDSAPPTWPVRSVRLLRKPLTKPLTWSHSLTPSSLLFSPQATRPASGCMRWRGMQRQSRKGPSGLSGACVLCPACGHGRTINNLHCAPSLGQAPLRAHPARVRSWAPLAEALVVSCVALGLVRRGRPLCGAAVAASASWLSARAAQRWPSLSTSAGGASKAPARLNPAHLPCAALCLLCAAAPRLWAALPAAVGVPLALLGGVAGLVVLGALALVGWIALRR